MLLSYLVNSILNTEGKNKNVKIAEVVNVEVAASGNITVIDDFSLGDYPYHYIAIKPNNTHKYKVNEQYKTGGVSMPYPAISVIDYSANSGGRTVTDWLKAKGEIVHIDIQNLDEESSHTYNIFVMGVR